MTCSGIVENSGNQLIVGEVISGKDDQVTVVGVEAGEGVTFKKTGSTGDIQAKIHSGHVAAAQYAVSDERQLIEPFKRRWRDSGRDVVLDGLPPVAFDLQ